MHSASSPSSIAFEPRKALRASATLEASHPKLIFARGSAFGSEGPDRNAPPLEFEEPTGNDATTVGGGFGGHNLPAISTTS